MSDDNIVEFKSKDKKSKIVDDNYTVDNVTINIDDIELSFTKESLDRLLNDMTTQDVQLNTLANDLFDLQLLVEKNPEIAQFVSSHIRKFTKNMAEKLSKK